MLIGCLAGPFIYSVIHSLIEHVLSTKKTDRDRGGFWADKAEPLRSFKTARKTPSSECIGSLMKASEAPSVYCNKRTGSLTYTRETSGDALWIVDSL